MEDHDRYLASFLLFYGALYGPQIVLIATLSAITIYRRELSSNHVYAEEEEEEGGEQGTKDTDELVPRREYIWNNKKADEILDGAGLFCSGSSLVPLVFKILELFCHSEDNGLKYHQREGDPISDDANETNLVSSLVPLRHNASAADLLELAGNYYCMEPMASLLFQKPMHIPISRANKTTDNHLISESKIQYRRKQSSFDDLMGLPTDAWVHILVFLNPQDVISFGGTNKECQRWIEQGESSHLLWKALWQRDFGWILQHWNVGIKAVQRSRQQKSQGKQKDENLNDYLSRYSKHSYFWFQLCFVDYVLAGCNTVDECLVGIAGHIYDISLFLLSHPGSPETVMVHAGQDATDFFQRIGHSKGARKIARSMCVVVDTGRLNPESSGLRPTSYTSLVPQDDSLVNSPPQPSAVNSPDESVMGRHHSVVYPNLEAIRVEFVTQQQKYNAKACRQFSNTSTLAQPKVFYDPITDEWKGWYMDEHMDNIFFDKL